MRKVTPDRGNSKYKGSGVRMGLMCIFPSSYGDIDLYLLVFGVEELSGSRIPSFIHIVIQQLFSAHFVPGTKCQWPTFIELLLLVLALQYVISCIFHTTQGILGR